LATETQVHEVLEALDFVGLSKGPPASTLAGRPGTAEGSFEFAHRRVHEYLAASFVRREPRRVPRAQLLTDGRWREAAVACLQLGDDRQLAGLLDAAAELLDRALAQVPDLVDDDDVDNTSPLQLSPDPVPFAWPVRVLHVLALLDAGLANRSSTIAEPLRRRAGRLLLTATRDGTTADRKTALGAVGSASQAVRERLLRAAFADDSAELRDAAYRQVGRLRQVPDDIAGHIRRMLLTLWGQGWAPRGELGRQQLTIRAQLLRLPEPEAFLATMRLVLRVPIVDLVIASAVCLRIVVVDHSAFSLLLVVGLLLYGYARRWKYAKPVGKAAPLANGLATLLKSFAVTARVLPVAALSLALGLALLSPLSDQPLEGAWIVILLVLLLGLTWAPAAVVMVENGAVRRRRDGWCPQLVVAQNMAAKSLRDARAHPVRALAGLAILIVCGLGVRISTASGEIIVDVVPVVKDMLNWLAIVVAWLLVVLIVVAILGALPVMLWLSLYTLTWEFPETRRMRRGRRWFRRWRRAPPRTATLSQVLEWLDCLRSTDQIRELLHIVRVNELLRHDSDVGDLAFVLAAAERIERYEQRLRETRRSGVRGVLDWLWSPTAQPDAAQWLWQATTRRVGTLQRAFGGPRELPTAATGRDSDTSSTTWSAPASGQMQRWLAQVTAGRRQPLLYYDHTCRDELVRILEQARPTD
jgi:hypothetical protein